jgi:hypothetical protein
MARRHQVNSALNYCTGTCNEIRVNPTVCMLTDRITDVLLPICCTPLLPAVSLLSYTYPTTVCAGSATVTHTPYINNEDSYFPVTFSSSGVGTIGSYVVHYTLASMESGNDYVIVGATSTATSIWTKCTEFSASVCGNVTISTTAGITFFFHSDASNAFNGFTAGGLVFD